MSEKLTKKELKSLQFRARKSSKAAKVLDDVETQRKEEQAKIAESIPKKRKTRRGHKGKGKPTGAHQKRYILFVGNLPYNVQESELKEYFKAGNPDTIRIRADKGFGFLEFNGVESKEIQERITACLNLHHTQFRNRAINVELSAGGGGNSEKRVEKIKAKNEKLQKKRLAKLKEERIKKHAKDNKPKPSGEGEGEEAAPVAGVHPSRLALINH